MDLKGTVDSNIFDKGLTVLELVELMQGILQYEPRL